jgi:HlyD family secretion protein
VPGGVETTGTEELGVESRRSVTRIGATLAACLALGAAAWLLLRSGAGDGAARYVTERIDRGPITSSVTASGVVEPVVTVQVGTYVSGPILALYADFNSPVERGQIVAKIDPAPFAVKVRQAEATLANARAGTEKARADLARKQLSLRRSRELRERDFLSQDELDAAVSEEAQATAQLALQQAGVRQAEAALEEARVQLGYTDIRSPVDGVVISRNVDVGQTVAASFQTPTLFQIAEDLSKMRVRASVSESDIGGVAEGQAASFGVDAWPGRRFEGRVVQVRSAPVSLLNVVTYDVVIEVDNASLALKPGMTATVAITTAHRDDALRVPLRALRFRPETPPGAIAAGEDGAAAFRIGASGALERVALRTGVRDERFAEVLEGGLAAGDSVAVAYERSAEPAASPQSPFQPRRPR